MQNAIDFGVLTFEVSLNQAVTHIDWKRRAIFCSILRIFDVGPVAYVEEIIVNC